MTGEEIRRRDRLGITAFDLFTPKRHR